MTDEWDYRISRGEDSGHWSCSGRERMWHYHTGRLEITFRPAPANQNTVLGHVLGLQPIAGVVKF